jgi:hypothetical protein
MKFVNKLAAGLMRILALILAALLCLPIVVPMASALTSNDEATLQKAYQTFVDTGVVKEFSVNVLPPDEVTYFITANSEDDVGLAIIAGVDAFSILTYSYPEVNTGGFMLYWEVQKGTAYVGLEIYPSDLWPIKDRLHPTESETIQVGNIITERAKQQKQQEQ